jgi:Uma2 family endonuclease
VSSNLIIGFMTEWIQFTSLLNKFTSPRMMEMVQSIAQTMDLDAFLQLPETKPASEFILNQILQKPMPQGKHSTIQAELLMLINARAKVSQLACAYPELRCVFGGAAIVPDIVVFRWPRIPRTESGRVANRFELAPDWAIEILSPDQSQTRVLDHLLHCCHHGTELGWLIDLAEESVLTVDLDARLRIYRGTEPLPVLPELELRVSPSEVFGWLMLEA